VFAEIDLKDFEEQLVAAKESGDADEIKELEGFMEAAKELIAEADEHEAHDAETGDELIERRLREVRADAFEEENAAATKAAGAPEALRQ
jgi:hypothetical protein